jgi:hypothetical protein
MRKSVRLPGAGAGDDEERRRRAFLTLSAAVLDGEALFWIQLSR